ncbi:hypothetical protein [Thiomonas sp. X19]
MSDRMAFTHAGCIHEMGAPEQLFASPQTPELRRFLSSIDR